MRRLKLTFKLVLAISFLALSVYSMTVHMGKRVQGGYSVRGVDVSSYQGYIDWEKLSENDIDFAFIKATEGSSHRDKSFERNILEIQATNLAVGAYHFMSFESDGKSQAENFISAVDKDEIDLPPVIDLELYGDYVDNPPPSIKIKEILAELIGAFREEYGRNPIIYTNRRAYALYVSGFFDECDIWICDVVKKPELPDGRAWTFWQYSHTEKLSGYRGEEEYIDMNVFAGTEEEFENYKKK